MNYIVIGNRIRKARKRNDERGICRGNGNFCGLC